jgi:hypothetical protein
LRIYLPKISEETIGLKVVFTCQAASGVNTGSVLIYSSGTDRLSQTGIAYPTSDFQAINRQLTTFVSLPYTFANGSIPTFYSGRYAWFRF